LFKPSYHEIPIYVPFVIKGILTKLIGASGILIIVAPFPGSEGND
jgi:hypothetical protein